MLRYLALRWNVNDLNANAAALRASRLVNASSKDWHIVFRIPGCIVLCIDACPPVNNVYLLPDKGGVVLGKLFRSHVDPSEVHRPVELDVDEADKIVKTGGRHLVDEYWGRYVAITNDTQTQTVRIMRGPASSLPCFYATFEGVHCCCSFTDDLTRTGMLKPSRNWNYITAYALYHVILDSSETMLNEFSKLRQGECLELPRSGEPRKRLYWDLTQIARSSPIEDLETAVAGTLRAAQLSVWGWASCFPKGIIQGLSGGFDSSGMIHLLHHAPHRPKVTCLYYDAPYSRSGNELDMAELAVKPTGYPLVVYDDDPMNVDLEPILNVPSSAEPWFLQYAATHSHLEHKLAQQYGASALFQGVGGDQVYFDERTKVPGALIHENGLLRALFKYKLASVISDIAHADRLFVWPLFRYALHQGWRSPPWNPRALPVDNVLLTPEAREAARRSSYLGEPWTHHSLDSLSWAKFDHLRSMSLTETFYDPLVPNGPDHLWPYLSQPSVENAARIRVRLLAYRGVKRAVARRAFSPMLPPEIVKRNRKSMVNQYFQREVATHAQFFQGLMLDGMLVKERIYDPQAIENAIREPTGRYARQAQYLAVQGKGLEVSVRNGPGTGTRHSREVLENVTLP